MSKFCPKILGQGAGSRNVVINRTEIFGSSFKVGKTAFVDPTYGVDPPVPNAGVLEDPSRPFKTAQAATDAIIAYTSQNPEFTLWRVSLGVGDNGKLTTGPNIIYEGPGSTALLGAVTILDTANALGGIEYASIVGGIDVFHDDSIQPFVFQRATFKIQNTTVVRRRALLPPFATASTGSTVNIPPSTTVANATSNIAINIQDADITIGILDSQIYVDTDENFTIANINGASPTVIFQANTILCNGNTPGIDVVGFSINNLGVEGSVGIDSNFTSLSGGINTFTGLVANNDIKGPVTMANEVYSSTSTATINISDFGSGLLDDVLNIQVLNTTINAPSSLAPIVNETTFIIIPSAVYNAPKTSILDLYLHGSGEDRTVNLPDDTVGQLIYLKNAAEIYNLTIKSGGGSGTIQNQSSRVLMGSPAPYPEIRLKSIALNTWV